jgi:two-component system, response regulator YesN
MESVSEKYYINSNTEYNLLFSLTATLSEKSRKDSGSGLKILIVEDEFNSREGLATLIEKISSDYEVCGKAADGEEGYEMTVSLRPDTVFVDIELPKLNGLKMIEKILNSNAEQSQTPSFVILSGYADFQYAQQAIRYGVEEYLLKPIMYDKLKSVLEKLMKLNDIKKISGVKKAIGQNRILSSVILNAKNDFKEALDIIKDSVIPLNMYLINIYYGNNTDTVSLTNEVDSFCEYYNFKNFFISTMNEYKFIAFFVNSEYEFSDMVKKINYSLIFSLRKFKFNDVTVTLLPIESIDMISESLNEIRRLNSWALTLGNDKVIYAELTRNIKCESNNKQINFDIEALTAIKNENFNELPKINSELLAYLKNNKYHPDQIKKICTSYAFSILVCYKEFNIDVYEKVQNEGLLDRFKDSCTIEELKECLDDLAHMCNVIAPIHEKVNSVLVKKIMNYIDSSYIGKVSLEEIANRMNVSPEYLSHLFTKEVGTSFSEYLKRYRISIAKKLMSNSNYKIYEIGEKIGYKDPKYFCKVFKDVTGFSPKEYMTMQ